MSLAVAIQMDPLETVAINADSTFALALEAQRRGFGLYHYLPKNLSWKDGRVLAKARPFKLQRVEGDHVQCGQPEILDLALVDVVPAAGEDAPNTGDGPSVEEGTDLEPEGFTWFRHGYRTDRCAGAGWMPLHSTGERRPAQPPKCTRWGWGLANGGCKHELKNSQTRLSLMWRGFSGEVCA